MNPKRQKKNKNHIQFSSFPKNNFKLTLGLFLKTIRVLKFTEIEVKEFLKFGIHSVESKPSDLQSLVDIPKNMVL